MRRTANAKKLPAGKVCSFCGGSLFECREKEHIIPNWLLKFQGIDKSINSFVAYELDGVPTAQRTQSMSEFLFGRVCGACNGGWMNDMEGIVGKFLPSLISGGSQVQNLSDDDRLVLARWVTKIAYCLDHALLEQPLVPDRHLHKLWRDADRLPDGLLVVAVSSPFTIEFDYFHMRNWFNRTSGGDLEAKLARLKRDHKRSYKVGIQFGRLILIVGFWPNAYERYSLVRNIHQPLWRDRGVDFDRVVAEDAEPFADHHDYLFSVTKEVGTCPSEPNRILPGENFKRITIQHQPTARGMRGGKPIA